MSRYNRIAERMVEAWGGSMSMPRSFYLQKSGITNLKQYQTDPALGLEIWTYDNAKGFPAGIAFWGKSNKPLWNFYYRNMAELEKKIQETIDSRKSHIDTREERRQERLNYKHGLKVGDILDSSWGYDQTNIDFYQVTAVGERTVKIREISSKIIKSGGVYGNDVVAVPDSFKGPEMTKLVSPGDRVKITSYASASKWDGRPLNETSPEFGH